MHWDIRVEFLKPGKPFCQDLTFLLSVIGPFDG